MNVLAFDTSTETLSVCLLTEKTFQLKETAESLKHAETLLPTIEHLMAHAHIGASDLDLLVCARGPGSFTGLRIGMTTAKGISEGSGVPLVSVDTLDAFALKYSFFDGIVVPVIDARKSRFYCALYKNGLRLTNQLDCTAEDLLHLTEEYNRVLLTGPGAGDLAALVDTLPETFQISSAKCHETGYSLVVLGLKRFKETGPDKEGQGPVYIRKSDAELNRMK